MRVQKGRIYKKYIVEQTIEVNYKKDEVNIMVMDNKGGVDEFEMIKGDKAIIQLECDIKLLGWWKEFFHLTKANGEWTITKKPGTVMYMRKG